MSEVTTPSAPSEVTAPPNRSSSRPSTTVEPSAVTSSTSRTADASGPLPTPEPCVPVATDPATEMCGSEAMFASARPRACTARASSAYRTPPPTRTVRAAVSTSTSAGRSASDSRTPSAPGSAISLKECPLPSTRTRALSATRARSACGECGRSSSLAAYVMLPAQLVTVTSAHTAETYPARLEGDPGGKPLPRGHTVRSRTPELGGDTGWTAVPRWSRI